MDGNGRDIEKGKNNDIIKGIEAIINEADAIFKEPGPTFLQNAEWRWILLSHKLMIMLN